MLDQVFDIENPICPLCCHKLDISANEDTYIKFFCTGLDSCSNFMAYAILKNNLYEIYVYFYLFDSKQIIIEENKQTLLDFYIKDSKVAEFTSIKPFKNKSELDRFKNKILYLI